MNRSGRINHEPAFMLSALPWRESSLRVEMYSRTYGRVSLLARSARKRQSELRGVLVPFVPVSVSWYGEGELKTLHRAEWLGGWPQPAGLGLFSAMYANELVGSLTGREDPNPQLYDALADVLQAVCTRNNHIAALRVFEWKLLQCSGLAPDISCDADGREIEEQAHYLMRPEAAPCRLPSVQTFETPFACIKGATLLDLAAGSFGSGENLHQALQLNRMMLDFRLPEIKTRRILQQLQAWSREERSTAQ
ncbi:MAG: DNA repair protein RecO [Neisseria sp.]|nr:DNA repair protein RecO [Neisseria sp.]